MKKLLSIVFALAMLLSLSACGEGSSAGKVVYAMDTVMNLTAYGKKDVTALDEAEGELIRLDQWLNRHSESSEISALNQLAGEPVEVSAELADLIALSIDIAEKTGGAFDPTIAPVMDAWGFGGDCYRVPSDDELSALQNAVDYTQIAVENGTVTIGKNQALDLGGIAKGYAGNLAKAIYEKNNCTGVIDLGGDVALVGTKGGKPWNVAIKDPANTGEYIGVLAASDVFVVTSGVYERGFTENGTYYHHIIDPKTLYPADSGLVSVTAVCSDGAYADALSTAAFVMGIDGALGLQSIFADDVSALEFIFVTDDGRVLYTSGLIDSFTPYEEGSYTYECIVETN